MTVHPRLVAIIDRIRQTSDGQGLAEYALILALIAIVAIVALIFLGSQVSDKLSVIGSHLQSRLALADTDPFLSDSPPEIGGLFHVRVGATHRAVAPRGPAGAPDRTLQETLRHAWIPAVSS